MDFRGLALEPGASEVVFRYQPDWAWSLWLTLLAWLGLLISGGLRSGEGEGLLRP